MDDRELLLAYLADRDVPCPSCTYNLRDLRSDTCPECGLELLDVDLSHRVDEGAERAIQSNETVVYIVIVVVLVCLIYACAATLDHSTLFSLT